MERGKGLVAAVSRESVNALTPHQVKYFAHELTLKRASDDAAKLTAALMDAQVDLNPHQVDAALFAFKSPLSKGAILADEVGLGKTIEAGLVVTQKWAEGKRRILVICPSSLRAQWRDELGEKFFLPSEVIESKNFNAALKRGDSNPFDRAGPESTVLICSFHFAANKELELLGVPWDLVVIDEAHRLRNVYKPDNKIGRKIRGALANVPKVLLTATPLQNSLMELYGLVSFVDEHAFGDAKTFRARYSRVTNDETFSDLKSRLAPLCHRTLRRQVTEYVKYTNRIPLTQEFVPTTDEQVLYDLVSEYLRRPDLHGLPNSQRALITLVLRKLLASSTFAIAGGLDSIARRLGAELRDAERRVASAVDAEADGTAESDAIEQISADVEHLPEIADEWGEDEDPAVEEEPPPSPQQVAALRSELAEIETLRDQAVSITENAKGVALIAALEAAFAKAHELGATEKAIIFTESRRTQNYLVELLADNGYASDLVLFNGSNSDDRAKEIYKTWMAQHAGTDRATGTRAADIRSALVDEFRNAGKIMIATEAAAEGVNLQFCSIVVNYDLPWNPQRIEQRIGRCHRYGQQHDVVVVNFLNRDNAADKRVYELLDQKFRLFSGVFGASDEILGAIESGVDIERRIVDIYQRCRQPDEIDAEFTQLQFELDEQISEVMEDTRQKLLENFDAEVHDRLKVNLAASRESISRAEALLWRITQRVLSRHASFNEATRSFRLDQDSGAWPRHRGEEFHLGGAGEPGQKYRLGHPLAEHVLAAAREAATESGILRFDYSAWPMTAAALEPLVGLSGWLAVEKLTIDGGETEEHLILAACADDGRVVDADDARRLLDVPASFTLSDDLPELAGIARARLEERRGAILAELANRQAQWFDQEIDKFDRWAEDQRHALRVELKDLDSELKDLKKRARTAGALPEKLALQRKAKELESRRDDAWRAYDDSSRDVETKKDELLDQVEARLRTETNAEELFTVRWELA